MSMHGKTILLVDDSPTNISAMVAALRDKGCRLVTAVDGESAIQIARDQQPDLVLLDVILPRMNGFQVCRQLKTTPDTRDIKIILVTSKSQESDRFWGMKQGADEYLTKPYTNDQLLASVARHV